jgi:hypothetical protein
MTACCCQRLRQHQPRLDTTHTSAARSTHGANSGGKGGCNLMLLLLLQRHGRPALGRHVWYLMLRLLPLLLRLLCRLVGLVRLPDMRLYARLKLATCLVPEAQ